MTYRTHALRCRGPEGKFFQAHLHCFLCSSCVRSLCCLNTMGGSRKLQHLSDRHSIIVTRRAMTTNAANANHRNAHLFLIYAIFFPLVPLLCKCLIKKILNFFSIQLSIIKQLPSLTTSLQQNHTLRLYTLLKHLWSLGSCCQTESPSTFANVSSFQTVCLASKTEFTTRKQVNKGQRSVLGLDLGIIYILS